MSNVSAVPSFIRSSKAVRLTAALAMVLGMFAPLSGAQPGYASTVSSAAFTGGTGTVSASGTLYAKNGGALTLTVNTSSDTKCVAVTGAFTARQTSNTAKSSWTFNFTAGAGDGVQTVTAAASPNFNANNCTGQTQSPQSASFVLDNTGPVVTAAVSPAPNAAGWNKSDVSITWSATDAGSGVASSPTPSADSQTTNTAGVTKTATATDRLGNAGGGSVTVKLDNAAPTILGSRSPVANANGWNNVPVTVSFTCSDNPASGSSGVKSCSGPTTLGAGANQAVTGAAVDNADNNASATVSGISIDVIPPTLQGHPIAPPNARGWYNTDVNIAWIPNDDLSGPDMSTFVPQTTISSEGANLTSSSTLKDRAGNIGGGTSSPPVNIDRTKPSTTADADPTWRNTGTTVHLSATDNLSGVASTLYTINGGAQQVYNSAAGIPFTAAGTYVLSFWSVDVAGNTETAKTANLNIDMTPPAVSASQSPAANSAGWNNTDVTVTFTCTDEGGSGLASCAGSTGSPATLAVTSQGADQDIPGTALDNAGNSTTGHQYVSIDKTPPTVTGAPDRAPNGSGWYNSDVTVAYTCDDSLSGIAVCPATETKGEGTNQSATGTAVDAAGNSTAASVNGINIDETAPSLGGTIAGGTGWHTGDVTIHWSCADSGGSGLSGPCPVDSTVMGEGNSLSASATISDFAGNSTSTTVSGIKIDRTAPTTLASVPAPLDSGWYAGAVLVTLTTAPDLSGVAHTYYRVDGGAEQPYSGPFSHSAPGVHTITFWSVDNAGNTEDSSAPGHSITLKIDNVPPSIAGSRAPAANGFGWNNAPVTVSFNCIDAESGIAGCSYPVTLSNEGAGQAVPGQAQDNAGNTASATVSGINIDLTAPTLTGAATTSPNAFGWYKGDVTIHWTGQDGLSGIDPATQPADSVITGEGSNLGAGPVSVSDQAGNVGSGSVSGIKIDRTSPTISGATVNDDGTPRSANAAGWFNSAVRVRFSCNDTLSGVQECGSDVVLSSDGANQGASGTASDRADNSAGTTVSGINIDSQAPNSDDSVSCNAINGWCHGGFASVNITAQDQAGLSGVKEIHYIVNGGSENVAPGASINGIHVNENGQGRGTIAFWSVDNAGNVEPRQTDTLKYDDIAPAVSHTVNPAPNAAGWNNQNVTVGFSAEDNASGSGVQSLSINGTVVTSQSSATPSPTLAATATVNTETTGQTFIASAQDFAGNTTNPGDSVTVKIDHTPPTISGAATTSPNANGWYNGPVTIHISCADQGAVQSGIATCPADVVLSTDGANQSASGTATDRAGNTASVTVSGINIDSTKPTISSISVANGAIYTLGDPAIPSGALTCTASDSGSGVASCNVTVTGGQPNGVGTFSFTAAATDNAGNTTTQTGSYVVHYRFDGFLQPINDVPHNPGQSLSVFRAGSTIPVKFQLKSSNGQVVQAASLPQWLNPQAGSPITLPVDETQYSDPGDTAYRWDPTAQQYIFNYHTASNQGGKGWRIFARLDDGQTVYVDVAMR